jgi:GTP 3',8-cyclase
MTISLGMPRIARRIDLAGRPDTAGLIDRFGRVATDLRVSLTDRCNLRCTYCMPADGLDWLPRDQAMSAEEIARLVGLGVRELGVQQVRFTGGEPLLRADLVEIISAVAALEPRPEISLTTNGIGLAGRAVALREAGLDRLNVSLDTVHAATFSEITRRPFLAKVLAGIDAARDAGIAPIKINAVLMPGVNDDQAADLLTWALREGHQLRFIEQMPLDADHVWSRDGMLTADDIRARLSAEYTLVPDEAPRDGAPAELYRVHPLGVPTAPPLGLVGIIASVTESFCADCRRTRLTAEGGVRSCLFSHDEIALMPALRGGGTDQEILDLWRGAMWAKPQGHGIDDPSFVQPDRPMSAIGG